jgi:hypothetical protein
MFQNKHYGIILISGLFDVINKIPLSYHITKSNENDFNKKHAYGIYACR